MHWGYELVENDLLWFTFFVHIKWVIIFFNTQELLKKAKDRYHNGGGKENAAEYYFENKEVLRKNAKNKYRNLSIEKKEAKIEYKKKDIEKWQKMKKKQTKRVSKKIPSNKKIKY